MSGPDGHQYTRQTKFQIASRLGGFRDTTDLSDPFGTGAVFTIVRKGSATHREWSKTWLESDPITSAMLEEQILGDDLIVLTDEEVGKVEAARALVPKQPASESLQPVVVALSSILPVIDRLVSSKADLDRTRAAAKRALASGRVTLTDLVSGSFQSLQQLQEAVFLLRHWKHFPDADGADIPYSGETAEELLQNDTPLDDPDLIPLLVSLPCWRIEVKDYTDDGTPIEGSERFIPASSSRSVLTLGRAYQRWIHWASEQTAHFRTRLVEEVVGNSEPPSDQTISSGGGTSPEASS